MTGVSVIIPVHNAVDDLRRCLQALAASARLPDEVIVVDDASTDGSAALARSLGARVLRLPMRGGPARARNVGARAARSDILFFVDADVAIHPDAVDQVVAAFRRGPDLAGVFGSYDDAPAATDFLSQYKNLFHHYVHQTSRRMAPQAPQKVDASSRAVW